MIPYADFTFFGIMLYAVIPTLILGLMGRLSGSWAFCLTLLYLIGQFSGKLELTPGHFVPYQLIVAGYAAYQWVLATLLLQARRRVKSDLVFGATLLLSLVPLITAKFLPLVSPHAQFGFLGISYVKRIFRGFLYKFILAALIKRFWVDHVTDDSLASTISYMYGYSLYLFFDFAGYSAFAIGFSYLFGIRTPENFNAPFLSTNIRDFWNRWNITLSFWFRDHVYMRFLIGAAKRKWYKNEQTASYLAYFLAFGLMGLWHGSELHYIVYGLYHACLLTLYDLFSRWKKRRQLGRTGRFWRLASILVTAHFVCFGFLIFSGKLLN